MEREHILVVEDDVDINNLIKKTLEKSGYEVTQAFSGSEASLRLEINDFNMILLDLMLPGITGEELIKNIRSRKDVPVIVISAKSSLQDKVNVLNIGADDYIVKPFSPSELVARVKAHISRYERLISKEPQKDTISIRGLRMDKESRRVYVNERELIFTTKEFDILLFLAMNPDHVFSKEQLFERLWGIDSFGDISTVTVHIRKIREKIEVDPSRP